MSDFGWWAEHVKEEAMKVRAKLLSDHYQYEVIEESPNYYIVYGTGGKVAVSKADYEPVQEWVTLYCLKDEWPCDRLKHDLRACWQGEYIVIQRKATR